MKFSDDKQDAKVEVKNDEEAWQAHCSKELELLKLHPRWSTQSSKFESTSYALSTLGGMSALACITPLDEGFPLLQGCCRQNTTFGSRKHPENDSRARGDTNQEPSVKTQLPFRSADEPNCHKLRRLFDYIKTSINNDT